MTAELVNPHLTWNLAHDLSEVLEYHFMVNALLAGSVVAVMAGLLGWLMVLRRETFAGHTLSMMAFPGAAGAALIGVAAAWGYFVFCVAGGLVIGRFSGGRGRSWSEQSAVIGSVQALALGLGFLFVSLYGGVLGDLDNLLFGTFLGISDGQVLVLPGVAWSRWRRSRCWVARCCSPRSTRTWRARGACRCGLGGRVPVLLGLAVAATSQITGVLLVFALLLMPAASAQTITARPGLSLVLTVAIGLAVVWLGLGIAYFSVYPAGFFVTSISFAIYVGVQVGAWARSARGGNPASERPRGRDRCACALRARAVCRGDGHRTEGSA